MFWNKYYIRIFTQQRALGVAGIEPEMSDKVGNAILTTLFNENHSHRMSYSQSVRNLKMFWNKYYIRTFTQQRALGVAGIEP